MTFLVLVFLKTGLRPTISRLCRRSPGMLQHRTAPKRPPWLARRFAQCPAVHDRGPSLQKRRRWMASSPEGTGEGARDGPGCGWGHPRLGHRPGEAWMTPGAANIQVASSPVPQLRFSALCVPDQHPDGWPLSAHARSINRVCFSGRPPKTRAMSLPSCMACWTNVSDAWGEWSSKMKPGFGKARHGPRCIQRNFL